MSNREELMQQASAWLQPLSGDDGPSGPDLEYDNAFLELSKAAAGKPETQFDRGAPPDWRSVRSMVEELFDRTRDLRIAILWLRASVALDGLAALGPGLNLVVTLLAEHWDDVHPKPDPADNDPYGRANALSSLPTMDGLLGELINCRIVAIKGVGELRVRDAEVAVGSLTPRSGEASYSRDQIEKMLAAADQAGEGVRTDILDAQQQLKRLTAAMDERFGSGSSVEMKPLVDLLGRLLSLTREPVSESAAEDGEEGAAGDGAAGAGAGGRRGGLSGGVGTRAEAIRAIDMVCDYLERAEPTNPAPLFLRRARALLERNFLELLKELAPNALDEVARTVGIDPSTVGEPPS